MQQNFSYWEKTSFLGGFDVIVVGSGIVGLTAAMHLKATHTSLRIAVLESGFLPSGASTKNAGFACFGSVSEAITEIRSGGLENFLELVEMRWQGLARLRRNLGDQSVDFRAYGGFELFRNSESVLAGECVEQVENLNKMLSSIIGTPDIYAVADAKIAGFGFAGINCLIENKQEGQIDTGKMMTALLARVAGLGVQIFNTCKVFRLHKTGDRFDLETSQGNFTAKKVIIATNAFASELLPEMDVIPGRGQVLVTAPIPHLKIRGTFHYNRGYTYFRNIGDRILLGGFRDLDIPGEQTTEIGLTEQIQGALEKLLAEVILPNENPVIEHRWSGVMGFGAELKPIVKVVSPGLYCAVRCSGMGIAMGSLLGEQVADLTGL